MKIGEALVKEGLINSEKLDLAIQQQQKENERLGSIVTKMGFLTAEQLAIFLAKFFNIPYISLKEIYKEIKPEIVKTIPENLAMRFKVMPISLEDSKLTIAMCDPLDYLAVDTLRLKTGCKIQRVVSSERDIVDSIEYCYHQNEHMKKYIEEFIALENENGHEKIEDSELLRTQASDPPVVQYVDSLLIQAANNNTSDVHIKPKQNKVQLNFRIDGVLHEMESPPKSMISAITTRLKILAHLDIAEHRLPQDGRFKILVRSIEIDLRVSCFPTIYGESIVLRLLNTSSGLMGLEKLGFLAHDLKRYRELIRNSYGLILITGPTGSGKTTTLYASLNEIKSTEKNIITLEDPVEYRLPFLSQSQVNPLIGFDFARGLRSILRQDPDIIMVGEIRDKETAEVAIHAALTGHLVFSTLHTNDAASAIIRMINMGVEPFLISSSLLGILAQRLVRCICNKCRKVHEADKETLEKLSLNNEAITYYKGTGCNKCFKSGYKGRDGVFELLVSDDKIRNLMLSRSSSEEIKKLAVGGGMKTMFESGIEKIRGGITTPEEVLRVTQLAQEA